MTPGQQCHPTTETVAENHKPRMLIGIHVQFAVPQCLDVCAELSHVPVGRLFSLSEIGSDQFQHRPVLRSSSFRRAALPLISFEVF